MLLQGVCLAVFVAVQLVNGAPLQDEKIETVPLTALCAHTLDKSNKSAILLLHGLTASYHDWDGVWEQLAIQTKREICAVDLRNHGDSPWSDRSDTEAMAADIGEFLDTHNIKKVNLIGHSLGGKIAVHYALNNPERVNSLIVEDMRPNGLTEDGLKLVKLFLQLLKQAIDNVPAGSNEDEARKVLVEFLNKKLKEMNIEETVDERVINGFQIRCEERCRLKMNIDVFLKHINDGTESFLIPSSGLYEGPTLFIYGQNSPFDVKGDQSNIVKLFPKARLVEVEGAGHVIHRIFPQFVDEVVNMVNGLEN